jgi:hypothetical protein
MSCHEGSPSLIDKEFSIRTQDPVNLASSREESSPAVMLVACGTTLYGFLAGLVIGLIF